MENVYVVGLDVSTTATKAILWNLEGRMISEGRTAIETVSPLPGWAEQNAIDWWTSCVAALRKSLYGIDPNRVAAVGLTHQRESFVLLDKHGVPLRNAILWSDARAVAEVKRFESEWGSEFHKISGKPPDLTASVFKLIWLRQNEPSVLDHADKVLDVYGYLASKLVGDTVTGWPSADPTGLFNMVEFTWDPKILQRVGLEAKQLPRLAEPGEVAGNITERAAQETGLPQGIPLAVGGGDGQCAGLGVGAIRPGCVYLNLGSAVVSGMISLKYITDKGFRTLCGCIPKTYVLESLLRGGASTIKWFLENLVNSPSDKAASSGVSVEEMLELAASKIPPGSLGLMAVPYWNAVCMPYWDPLARGMVIGWHLAHEKGHFYRALLEGIAFEQRLLYEGMTKVTSQTIDEVRVLGGGSKSRLWCQIIADTISAPVSIPFTIEATCLGSGMLAAKAAGLYSSVEEASQQMSSIRQTIKPDEEHVPIYHELYNQVYKNIYPSLREVADKLTSLSFATK